MKKIFLSMSLCFTTICNSQNFTLGAKSEDAELDASLNEINIKAKNDIVTFKKELAAEYNIVESKINNMLDQNMSPADVFMTVQVANIVKKDPDVVVTSYNKNKNKGWGAIAKDLGIKPGSAEFHALKGKAKNKKDKGGKGNGKAKGKGKNK